jgi:hypothetical protein
MDKNEAAQDVRELADQIDRLYASAEHCPNCPDQGWFTDGPTDDPEQVQCEFCYTVETSLFNIKAKVLEIIQARLASARAEGEESIKGEIEREWMLKGWDNHHNAATCPHCNEGLKETWASLKARAEIAERKGEEMRASLYLARRQYGEIRAK